MMKDKKNKIIKIVLIVLSVLAVLSAALFVYVWQKLSLIEQSTGEQSTQAPVIQEIPVDEENLTEEDLEGLDEDVVITYKKGEVASAEHVINVLLLGTDERRQGFSDTARSDSMMMASVNLKKGTVKLVSFQRGMGVPILDGAYAGQYDWLTHCFNYGGAELVMREIEYCFGVKVDYYVRVNFYTFQEIVNALGGVDVNVEAHVADALNGRTSKKVMTKHRMTEGINHLDGYDALQFARVRSCDSDWQRIERQRQVIQGMVNQLKGMSVLELNSMLDTILPLIQTSMPVTEMMSLIPQIPSVITSDIEQMSLPLQGTYGSMSGLGGRSMYSVDFAQNAAILVDFLYNQ